MVSPGLVCIDDVVTVFVADDGRTQGLSGAHFVFRVFPHGYFHPVAVAIPRHVFHGLGLVVLHRHDVAGRVEHRVVVVVFGCIDFIDLHGHSLVHHVLIVNIYFQASGIAP